MATTQNPLPIASDEWSIVRLQKNDLYRITSSHTPGKIALCERRDVAYAIAAVPALISALEAILERNRGVSFFGEELARQALAAAKTKIP